MEARVSSSLGSSLKVPIVQELAKEKLSNVPSRYIRPDHHHHLTPSHISSSPQIPVIDMQKLLHPDSMDSELHHMHNASKEWGFFQLINHGVDSAVMEIMKSEIQEFFNLPIEEKNKFLQESGSLEGYGQAFVVSDEQKLDWADLFTVNTLPSRLRNPNLFPKLPPSFRHAIEAYSAQLKLLAMKILNLMAKALGMEEQEIEKVFGEGIQSMRMNYYPPCPQPELVTGLYPHSDPGGLTILLQANEMVGLEIKKDGIWIPVSPLPHAFIINIGDILEITTNGIYRSIEHRVSVNKEKERISIATFLSTNLDGDVGPSASLVTPETPPKFKTIALTDYFKRLFSHELNGKSNLDVMRM